MIFIALQTSYVLLDCTRPHLYKAEEESVFDWFHFAGNAKKVYFN
jgi:AraC family transcriptional regulator